MNSIYWVVVAGTSIGFGDFYPEHASTRLFCFLFLPFTVAVLGEFLSRVAGAYMSRKKRTSERRFMQRTLTLTDLETMDLDQDGRVKKSEFLTYVLVALQKVNKEDVRAINALFEKLDVTNSGYLSKADLVRRGFDQTFRKSFKLGHSQPLLVIDEDDSSYGSLLNEEVGSS